MRYIGIDPGKSGGIAVLDASGGVVNVFPMPSTERDIMDALREFSEGAKAVIESVHSMPGQGVVSTFKFGMGYGGLRMALVGLGIPFAAVTPVSWQKTFGLTKGKHPTKVAKKNANKARAQELFPSEKITHKVADALLLAEYCRRANSFKVVP